MIGLFERPGKDHCNARQPLTYQTSTMHQKKHLAGPGTGKMFLKRSSQYSPSEVTIVTGNGEQRRWQDDR